MQTLHPAAFLSYVHSDDDHDNGRITKLRSRIEGEVRMHTGKPFKVFQDRNDLEWGQNWQERIESSLEEVTFLIPVITPSFFNSPACQKELDLFISRESSLGTNQLILPIYYLESDLIEEDSGNTNANVLRSRQYSDWRHLRFLPFDHHDVAAQFANLAADIKKRSRHLADIIQASSPRAPISEKEISEQIIETVRDRLVAGDSLEEVGDASFELLLEHDKPAPVTKMPKRKRSLAKREPYKAYTTEFDEVVDADNFLVGQESLALTRLTTKLASQISTVYKKHLDDLSTQIDAWKQSGEVSVLFLLDNSGSLRDRPISFISAWTLQICGVLENSGCEVSAVGFTTRAWKGGQSREKWLKEGRPLNPGRLNDVRYITYKDFDSPLVSAVQNFGVMLKPGILKENIDGEALEYGLSLIQARSNPNKMIVFISDGAPVDDSTLTENSGSFLERHLRDVISNIRKTDVRFIAVGVEHDVTRYFGDDGISSTAETLGVSILKKFTQKNEIIA